MTGSGIVSCVSFLRIRTLYIGVSVMASEMLTQVLYQGVEEFEDIVKAAIITTGNDDYQSLVMKEMFPDSPVPDKD